MRRRGVGIGAVRKKQEQAKQFSEVGEQLVEANLSHVSSQLELFRTNLQAFAIKYKNNIKKDPDFRRKFQVMCAKIGVDPLASKKGFWSELLDVGDFYYELAVQIIEVGIITRPKNGGLIGMSDLLRLLEKKRGPAMQIVSDDDVKRSVKKLSVLGEGFQLIDMEERTMIVTVPVVLSQDHSTILALAQMTGGMVNVSILARELQWDKKRSMLALNVLLREGMTWLDEQTSEPSYFFPSITLSDMMKLKCLKCSGSFYVEVVSQFWIVLYRGMSCIAHTNISSRWGSHVSCASTATSRSRTRMRRASDTTAGATTRPTSNSGTTASQIKSDMQPLLEARLVCKTQ